MKNIVFLFFFMLFGFGILYFLLKSEDPATALQNDLNRDDDADGVINASDKEPNNKWIKDTTYKLRDFVDTEGKLNRIKVDSLLCNCFTVPDSSERTIIGCKDNAEYFVFEGKLWRYDEATNRFYDAYGVAIKNGNNAISERHSIFLKVANDVFDENNGVKSSRDIVFNNIKYNVPYKLTSEEGITYNAADYRYYSGKWETRIVSGTGSWIKASANDIVFLLAKIGKKVVVNTEVSPEIETKDVLETKPIAKPAETSNSGNAADEFYLGYCKNDDPNNLRNTKICNELVLIKKYSGIPKTANGARAKKNIFNFIRENCN